MAENTRDYYVTNVKIGEKLDTMNIASNADKYLVLVKPNSTVPFNLPYDSTYKRIMLGKGGGS